MTTGAPSVGSNPAIALWRRQLMHFFAFLVEFECFYLYRNHGNAADPLSVSLLRPHTTIPQEVSVIAYG